jgi:hypothetical protein
MLLGVEIGFNKTDVTDGEKVHFVEGQQELKDQKDPRDAEHIFPLTSNQMVTYIHGT